MVTENVEQPIPQPDSSPDTGTVEAEVTPQAEATGEAPQPETVAEAPAEPTQTEGQLPLPSTGPAPVEPQQPMPPTPATPQYTPEQITKMQQDANQYAQVQQRAALQGQADTYKTQLESQGYLPEHAEQAANQYMQSQEQQMKLMQQAEQWGQHLQGKQIAAEHFAKKYNLSIDDLSALKVYDDQERMENAAKTISHNRQRDAELSALKQSRVPPQQVDNSQGSPEVAADEGSWLDRYNSGDRTANAVAAARRAAGLQ